MEKMRYKPLDKVRIKSLDWYNENKDEYGVVSCGEQNFVKGMKKFCSKTLTISEDAGDGFLMLEDYNGYVWTDEMIEGLVEEEVDFDLIPKFGEYSDNEPLDVPTMTTDFVKEHGLPCPEGYIFKDENGNEILTSKIILEKKKKEYPKTYEECCKVLGIDTLGHSADGYKWEILSTFQNLLICRDAYWKIAGEEMGLGKPWEPDYTKDRYIICRLEDKILKGYRISGLVEHFILEFPTEKMRDAFYENFKELIESVKELL